MGVLTPLAVKVGSLESMPRLLPQITATDTFLQKFTRGRLTVLDVAGLPNLKLHARGRRSGQWRETPLLAVPRAGKWLIAGSNFGGPKQPAWVGNIEANPDCQVTVGGRTEDVMARRLEGEKRDAAFEFMALTWPNYKLYERRTRGSRTIKVFELRPR